MIIYFDSETTGLYPGKIVQLAYILETKDGVTAKNFYFAVPFVSPSATAVHGYTVEILQNLSNGKIFEDFADEIFEDFSKANLLVAHNFKFDLDFLSAEFSYINREFKFIESFDTMRYFTPILKLKRLSCDSFKFPKLSELFAHFEIYPYDISRKVKDLFLSYSTATHEARFDATAMYLSTKKAREQLQDLDEYFTKFL